jgi:hypothetical protein
MQHTYYCPKCNSEVIFGTKSCADCGTQFDWQLFKPVINARQLLKQHQPKQHNSNDIQQLTKRKISPKIALLWCAIVIVLLIFGSVLWALFVNNSPMSSTITNSNAIVITATQLYEEYNANEEAANAKYKGKIIKINGIVNEIGIDRVDTPYVILTGSGQNGLFGVQCMFSSKDELKAAQLFEGQSLTIEGICQGFGLDVILKNCKIK